MFEKTKKYLTTDVIFENSPDEIKKTLINQNQIKYFPEEISASDWKISDINNLDYFIDPQVI